MIGTSYCWGCLFLVFAFGVGWALNPSTAGCRCHCQWCCAAVVLVSDLSTCCGHRISYYKHVFLPPAFTCSIQYTRCVIYMACGKVFNWRMGTRQAGLFTPSADGTNQAVLWGSWLEIQESCQQDDILALLGLWVYMSLFGSVWDGFHGCTTKYIHCIKWYR